MKHRLIKCIQFTVVDLLQVSKSNMKQNANQNNHKQSKKTIEILRETTTKIHVTTVAKKTYFFYNSTMKYDLNKTPNG